MSLPASPPPKPLNADDCNWAMLAHLSALLMLVIPLGHVVAPFIIWRIYRETSPFIADQAKESLNAQISYSLYGLAAGVLVLLLIGLPLLLLIWAGNIILVIIAAFKASKGVAFRYPLIIRFVQ